MNGFLDFRTSAERDEFVAKLARRHPSLSRKIYVARSKPQCIVEDISPEELQEMQADFTDGTQWFGDVNFQSTPFAG
jgi:hypothetical protein